MGSITGIKMYEEDEEKTLTENLEEKTKQK